MCNSILISFSKIDWTQEERRARSCNAFGQCTVTTTTTTVTATSAAVPAASASSAATVVTVVWPVRYILSTPLNSRGYGFFVDADECGLWELLDLNGKPHLIATSFFAFRQYTESHIQTHSHTIRSVHSNCCTGKFHEKKEEQSEELRENQKTDVIRGELCECMHFHYSIPL